MREAAQLEFADEQPSHDGLTRARIVGEQESPRELEHVIIDRLELMGQGGNARHRGPKYQSRERRMS